MRILVGLAFIGVIAAVGGLLYRGLLRPSYNDVPVGALADVSAFKALTSERERALKPKDIFKECSVCPEMVVVPAGEFLMGSPETETGRGNDEGPRHKVTIAKPFAVSRFEVTFEQWDACVELGGCSHKPSDAGWGRGNQPVIDVNWQDMQQYIAWLSKLTGKTYRLLSETEWEYAARAGSDKLYSWGDEIGKENANCRGCGGTLDGSRNAPVGSFAANAFGLYDMHGNVWERVSDCYASDYNGAPTDGSARTDGDCNRRVSRGGSGADSPQFLRSARRAWGNINDRFVATGFRLGRSITP